VEGCPFQLGNLDPTVEERRKGEGLGDELVRGIQALHFPIQALHTVLHSRTARELT